MPLAGPGEPSGLLAATGFGSLRDELPQSRGNVNAFQFRLKLASIYRLHSCSSRSSMLDC